MELKKAITRLRKDRYVSSMMREELETVLAALDALQAAQTPQVPIAVVTDKLNEALALLKGDSATANSKSQTKRPPKSPRRDRDPEAVRPREATAVAAKA